MLQLRSGANSPLTTTYDPAYKEITVTQQNRLLQTLNSTQTDLESAALSLNDACHNLDAYTLDHKHLRLLRSTRNNTERMNRIVKSLIVAATEALLPKPILPGLEDALLTAAQEQPQSQSPHNGQPPRPK